MRVIIPTKSNFDDLMNLYYQIRRDPAVNHIHLVGDGHDVAHKLHNMFDGVVGPETTVDWVDKSIGLHKMWNQGLDANTMADDHVAIINDDVTLSDGALGIVEDLFNRRFTIGLVTPSAETSFTDEFVQSFGFAGYCMCLRRELARSFRFDERMKWWYGDNDIIKWVQHNTDYKVGITGLCYATGNRSATINNDPPPNFHADIENDAALFKEKWGVGD